MQDLTIRPLRLADAEGIYQLISHNRVHLEKYFPITSRQVTSRDAAIKYVANKCKNEQKGTGVYRVAESTTGGLIAYALIKNVDRSIPKGEVAYFTDAAFIGRGVMSYLLAHLIREAFDKLDFHKLYLLADEKNHPSCRVAEKAGFQKEGLIRDDYRTGLGDLVNSRYYGLLKSEWEKSF